MPVNERKKKQESTLTVCSTVLSSVLKDVFHHLSSPGAEAPSVGADSDSLTGARIRW